LEQILFAGTYEISKKQFHDILNKRLSKLKPYVTYAKMASFLNGISLVKMPQSRDISRAESDFLSVLRTLSRYYLSNVHVLYVFNKLKLQKQSKKYHIQEMRKILALMIK